MSLAVKYRPQTFEEVVGQNITTTILNRAVEKKAFKNCYIFSGASGCGKTTCARIFANRINGGIGYPIEIDAASNNGVEDVRAIVAAAEERSIYSEYKVYIIDECQSMTSAAWQAFLKKIEECPKYTIFIFCTTEPQKLPLTILNRMQRYNFAPIKPEDIQGRLEYICQQEGFTNYQETCNFISKIVGGSMRNAISYLEQCADYSTNLDIKIAKQIIGGFSYEAIFKLTWALFDNNTIDIFKAIDDMTIEGQDLKAFIDWYLSFILDLIKYILFKDIHITTLPEYLATEANPVVQFTVERENALTKFSYITDKLLELKSTIKYDLNYKNTIIVYFTQIARYLAEVGV